MLRFVPFIHLLSIDCGSMCNNCNNITTDLVLQQFFFFFKFLFFVSRHVPSEGVGFLNINTEELQGNGFATKNILFNILKWWSVECRDGEYDTINE